MRFLAILLLSISASLVSGHARIKSPKPLNAPAEDPTGNAYNAPLNPDGSDFPCKQLHKKAGVDMTPTESWAAGSTGSFEILGHVTPGEGALAAHSGGSCQASLSYDNGTTWSVLKSFQGGCPRDVPLNSNLAGPDQVFPFPIPAEAKAGAALFAWTWTAVTGNRDEFYMNCASVEITGSGTSTLADYPAMYVGDMNIPGQIATGECRSTAGSALLYPNPGTEVADVTVAGITFKKPSAGNCHAPGSAGGTPGVSSPAPVQPTATSSAGFGKTSTIAVLPTSTALVGTSTKGYGSPGYGATGSSPNVQPTTSVAVDAGSSSGDNGFNTPIETPTDFNQQPTTTADAVEATGTPCNDGQGNGQMTQAPTGGNSGGSGRYGKGGSPTTLVTMTSAPQPSTSAGTEGVLGDSEVVNSEGTASTTVAGGSGSYNGGYGGGYGGGYRRARRARH